MSRSHFTILWLIGTIAFGCAEPTTPPAGKTFSIVDPAGLPPGEFGIVLPDTVSGGSPIAVPFYTWGSSSCTVEAGEDIATAGRVVTLTPYDRALSRNAVCTDDLHRFARQTTVSVPTGEVTFQLRGRRVGAGSEDELVILTRTVIVRSQ